MSNEPMALRLADGIADRSDWYEFDPSAWCPQASAELRRLHALNADLVEVLLQIIEQHGQWNNGIWAANIARAAIAKAEASQ